MLNEKYNKLFEHGINEVSNNEVVADITRDAFMRFRNSLSAYNQEGLFWIKDAVKRAYNASGKVIDKVEIYGGETVKHIKSKQNWSEKNIFIKNFPKELLPRLQAELFDNDREHFKGPEYMVHDMNGMYVWSYPKDKEKLLMLSVSFNMEKEDGHIHVIHAIDVDAYEEIIHSSVATDKAWGKEVRKDIRNFQKWI